MAAPFRQAAQELQVHPATLRRWLREGAPQVRRGRRGKGGAALIDVAAIRAWRGQGAASATTIPARVLAAEVPELLASAICEVFHAIEGPHKRACAMCWPRPGIPARVRCATDWRRSTRDS